MQRAETAILDIDGTLVDTNYQHVVAWQRAFRAHGLQVAGSRIHAHVGMGGDRLVEEVAGRDFERERGDEVRAAEGEAYGDMIDEIGPLDGAEDLLSELRRHDYRVVLASSAKPDEVERYVEILGARELADGWTTSEDVDSTKPSSELVEAALRIGSAPAVMVGDTAWDIIAARKAGVPCLAVTTGGIGPLELRAAGAAGVYGSVSDLAAELRRGARLEDAASENGNRSAVPGQSMRRHGSGRPHKSDPARTPR
jgi:phosphoglycolate phosphatase-like HAD superfamily hydrolase